MINYGFVWPWIVGGPRFGQANWCCDDAGTDLGNQSVTTRRTVAATDGAKIIKSRFERYSGRPVRCCWPNLSRPTAALTDLPKTAGVTSWYGTNVTDEDNHPKVKKTSCTAETGSGALWLLSAVACYGKAGTPSTVAFKQFLLLFS